MTSLYVNTLEELEKAINKRDEIIWIDVTLQDITLKNSQQSTIKIPVTTDNHNHGFNETVLWLLDQLFYQLSLQPIKESKKQQIIQKMTQYYRIELKNGLIYLSLK